MFFKFKNSANPNKNNAAIFPIKIKRLFNNGIKKTIISNSKATIVKKETFLVLLEKL